MTPSRPPSHPAAPAARVQNTSRALRRTGGPGPLSERRVTDAERGDGEEVGDLGGGAAGAGGGDAGAAAVEAEIEADREGLSADAVGADADGGVDGEVDPAAVEGAACRGDADAGGGAEGC